MKLLVQSPGQTIEQTLNQRGTRYGAFPSLAHLSQKLKRAMARGKTWGMIPADQQESLEMIAHKIARILNGDADYIDNWHDIIGYARLITDRLEAEQAAEQQQDAP